MALILKGINKSFGAHEVLRDFNASFAEGQITCIMGPSGCGKTTLLNIIGGVIQPDAGEISGFAGKCFSYIFQDPRLLPWKSVRDNVEFVLSRSLSEKERKERCEEFLKLVELDKFADYYPSQLSGGMSQRVAIARAFAFPSDVILMDEPFKGLDADLRQNIILRFLEIWRRDRRTVICVTHDVEEAKMLQGDILEPF